MIIYCCKNSITIFLKTWKTSKSFKWSIFLMSSLWRITYTDLDMLYISTNSSWQHCLFTSHNSQLSRVLYEILIFSTVKNCRYYSLSLNFPKGSENFDRWYFNNIDNVPFIYHSFYEKFKCYENDIDDVSQFWRLKIDVSIIYY